MHSFEPSKRFDWGNLFNLNLLEKNTNGRNWPSIGEYRHPQVGRFRCCTKASPVYWSIEEIARIFQGNWRFRGASWNMFWKGSQGAKDCFLYTPCQSTSRPCSLETYIVWTSEWDQLGRHIRLIRVKEHQGHWMWETLRTWRYCLVCWTVAVIVGAYHDSNQWLTSRRPWLLITSILIHRSRWRFFRKEITI